jgi:hypothetical protein
MNDYKNYLIDVLKNPSFKLNIIDGKLSKNDSIYFKTILKNLINEKKIFIDKDIKNYMKSKILIKSEININDIEQYILLLYLIINLNKVYLDPSRWWMCQYYNEYHNFKLHTKLINLEYFKENEIKPDILKWMIEKFINLDNHFIFVDYFIYSLKLGLSINLKFNLLKPLEINPGTNLKNYDGATYCFIKQIDEILINPPTKKIKNYFQNLHYIKIKEEKEIIIDYSKYNTVYENNNNNNNLIMTF